MSIVSGANAPTAEEVDAVLKGNSGYFARAEAGSWRIEAANDLVVGLLLVKKETAGPLQHYLSHAINGHDAYVSAAGGFDGRTPGRKLALVLAARTDDDFDTICDQFANLVNTATAE